MLDKERCIGTIHHRFISNYFMLVALKSPVTSRAKFEVVLQKPFLLVVVNHSKSDFSTINWVAFSEEIRQVYSTEILSITATTREVNSTEIDSV